MTILKVFSYFQKNAMSQIFSSAFFFTQVQKTSQIDRGILFHEHSNMKTWNLIQFAFLTYCFMIDGPFSFTICSSMHWKSSFEIELLKLWLKWFIRDLALWPLSLVIFFVVQKMVILYIMSSNLDLAITFLMSSVPMTKITFYCW